MKKTRVKANTGRKVARRRENNEANVYGEGACNRGTIDIL